MAILEISKIVKYEFWYIDTDSFIVSIKTEDVYKDIAIDVTHQAMKLKDHYQQEKNKK